MMFSRPTAAAGLIGLLAGLTAGLIFAARDKPAFAQSFSTGQPAVSAASAGPGATDMWAIDVRTNQVIYCRSSGGAPVCRASLVPGAAQPMNSQPRDNLPR